MNKFEEIQLLIQQLPVAFPTENVTLENAFNRVLREEVIADMDMPPFHKSAMDGFACHLEDIENTLEILEVIHAGTMPSKKVGKSQCVKIMTGAAIPAGCDVVFKVEDSEIVDADHVRCLNPKTYHNICFRGEDYHLGDVLIKSGTIVNTPQMAVLAGAGYTTVKVAVSPRITVIATGSELVHPSEKPQGGQIRNSNTSQVLSQLKKMGMEVIHNLMLADDYETLKNTFFQSLQYSDIIIFTGGASVGEFDLIPELLKESGFRIFWDRTGIKPGNPMTFSQKENKFVIGLSGNPVSSLAQFEFIAKPVVYKLLGANYRAMRIQSVMNFDYFRKKADRMAIVPVIINHEGLIDEIPFHGSAHINALVNANALLEVPQDVTQLKKGTAAHVRPL